MEPFNQSANFQMQQGIMDPQMNQMAFMPNLPTPEIQQTQLANGNELKIQQMDKSQTESKSNK